MQQASKVYVEPWEVRSRLGALGIPPEALRESVKQGFGAWAGCTADHPKSFPGILLWGETLGDLRRRLRRLGWAVADPSNQPLAFDPSEKFALTVATGTKETGIAGETPTTSSPKGPHTVQVVEQNRQGRFPFWNEIVKSVPTLEGRETWFLLVYCDTRNSVVRSELSLPLDMDEKGFVSEWQERIILDSFEFDGTSNEDRTPQDQSPEIDIEVRRRANP